MIDTQLSATQLNLIRTMTADSMVERKTTSERGESEVLAKQHT